MEDVRRDPFSCYLCLDVGSNAVECNNCAQLFCKECATCLRSCPVCRISPLTTTVKKSITCSVTNCGFKGSGEAFMRHVTERHSKEVIAYFSAQGARPQPYQPVRECIERKGNARIGVNGKYYCGQRLNGNCGCCNGYCGPSDGCNCQSCMQLDVAARALPKGHLVNREGRTARAGLNSVWYCGAKVMSGVPGCDGWCGPTNGPQCSACQRLQAQLNTRYSAIVATWQSAQARF